MTYKQTLKGNISVSPLADEKQILKLIKDKLPAPHESWTITYHRQQAASGAKGYMVGYVAERIK